MKETHYWENRYKTGGTSGAGSIGEYRTWKHEIIKKYAKKVDNVIDVGCGDLSFWENRTCLKYVGIDMSKTIIETNKLKRPHWTFICSPAEVQQNMRANIVLCLDVLFHILDDGVYEKILYNLTKYAKKFIFIYTWEKNIFADKKIMRYTRLSLLRYLKLWTLLKTYREKTSDFSYQKYRDFSKYFNIFENNGFKLVAIEKPKFDKFGAMYIFAPKR